MMTQRQRKLTERNARNSGDMKKRNSTGRAMVSPAGIISSTIGVVASATVNAGKALTGGYDENFKVGTQRQLNPDAHPHASTG